jgi:hypothetical protein
MILGPDSFRKMPWANGKGVTLELLRLHGPRGLLFRLSRAQVVEDGPFSLFPGIERSLTVLTGPGFALRGEGIDLRALPLQPVDFPGDVPIRAEGVTGPSDDFNVMRARALSRPVVQVLRPGEAVGGEWVFAHALAGARVSGRPLAEGELLVTPGAVSVDQGGPVLAVAMDGLPVDQMRNIG